MFIRFCQDEKPHTSHVYVKHWVKAELPLLPDHIAKKLPDEWDSPYQCKGLKLPGKTWAESLGIKVPKNAPGGQRLISPNLYSSGRRSSPQNTNEIDYEGFHDNDGFRKSRDD